MICREGIIENATPTKQEILVVFTVNGVPRNVMVTDEGLAAKLAATPRMMVNPARASVEAEVFEAAEATLNA